MSQKQVLVVEDERDVKNLMALHLEREGYQVRSVENGEQALEILAAEKFDLIVLDWMLPGVSGLEICKRIARKTPVLMVTARADASDIVLGLEVGADDYITKPFEVPVFLARARAILRRGTIVAGLQAQQNLKIDRLEVNIEGHKTFCSGVEIQLTASEFKLLVALMQNQGRVLSRDKLIELVQGQGVVVVDRAIDTHVFGLRKKLGDCADLIETIRGVGYRVRTDGSN